MQHKRRERFNQLNLFYCWNLVTGHCLPALRRHGLNISDTAYYQPMYNLSFLSSYSISWGKLPFTQATVCAKSYCCRHLRSRLLSWLCSFLSGCNEIVIFWVNSILGHIVWSSTIGPLFYFHLHCWSKPSSLFFESRSSIMVWWYLGVSSWLSCRGYLLSGENA